MKYTLTFALVASLTGTAFAAFQAPLPEFKNEKQLAEWRAEKAAEAISQGSTAEDSAFYTGRPYLASTGNYAFKFRSYNPEVARWTSEDPSGFPDGANASFYAPTPTNELDEFGLSVRKIFSYGTSWFSVHFDMQIDETSGPTLTSAYTSGISAPFTSVTLGATTVQNSKKSTTTQGKTKWNFDLNGTITLAQSIGLKITWPTELNLTVGTSNPFPFSEKESYTFE